MKKEIIVYLFCLFFISSCQIDFSIRQDLPKEEYLIEHSTGLEYSSNTLVVKYKDGKISNLPVGKNYISVSSVNFPRSLEEIHNRHSVKEIKRVVPISDKFPNLDRVLVLKVEGNIDELYNNLLKDDNIEYVLRDYKVSLYADYVSEFPNDPLFEGQWALHNTGQLYPLGGPGLFDTDLDYPEFLSLNNGSQEIIVGVLDSGVDYYHPDLINNIWINTNESLNGEDTDGNGYVDDVYGYDFSDDDSDPSDYLGHGTHCAGIIGAEVNNSIGISGVCPNCKIMPLKFFPSSTYTNAISGMVYAAENGAKIISNSWGCNDGCASWPPIEETISDMYNQGILVVWAAGNDNNDISPDEIYYSPQSMSPEEHLLVVSSTNSQDERSSFSNYGENIDVSAPGTTILSLRGNDTDVYCFMFGNCGTHTFNEEGVLDQQGEYYVSSGTSQAAPFVAGLAGAIWSNYPDWTIEQVILQIKSTVDYIDYLNPNYENLLGTGRVNLAYSLLNMDSQAHSLSITSDYFRLPPGQHLITKVNETLNIPINITNLGANSESNINLNFKINEELFDQLVISNLSVGQTINVSFNVNLTNFYYSNISFEIEPVQGEYYFTDNFLEGRIWVYNYDTSPIYGVIDGDNQILDCEEQ